MTTYIQETILAMELNGSHIGRLVQIITEDWSITGTLSRVDQHDNREWEIDYSSLVRSVRRSGGEIYATLTVGPWEGRVIGNQPVTVETVKGSLVAPERAALMAPDWRGANAEYLRGEIEAGIIHKDDARAYLSRDLPPAPEEWPDLQPGGPVPKWLVDLGGPDSVHAAIPGLEGGLCGLGGGIGVKISYQPGKITCPECRRRLKL